MGFEFHIEWEVLKTHIKRTKLTGGSSPAAQEVLVFSLGAPVARNFLHPLPLHTCNTPDPSTFTLGAPAALHFFIYCAFAEGNKATLEFQPLFFSI